MPIEIRDRGKFIELSAKATEIRVVRREREGVAKVKARTKRYLYTIKIPLKELNSFLKELKCSNIIEIGAKGEKKVTSEESS